MEMINKDQTDVVLNYDEEIFAGYSAELKPKTAAERTWGIGKFATLWMGSIHNILSYMTVAGFFLLGLNSKQVIIAVMTSAAIVSALYVINGLASAKYGFPFTMQLRAIFGEKGAIVPALARGLIKGAVFFGTQTVISAQAFDVIFKRLYPAFDQIGGGATIFGLPIYTAISFVLVWLVTIALFLAGKNVLDKLGSWSSPIVYIFIVGAAIWAINIAGGFGNVYNFVPDNPKFSIPLFIACVSALVSNWAGPIVNIGDFTQKAKDKKAMIIGLPLGFMMSYVLFAVTCVSLIAGTKIAFNSSIFNIVDAIDKIQNPLAVIVLILALNLGSLSLVVFGNMLPAGLQLEALFPKKLTVASGAIITAICGTVIMPWKLVANQGSLYYFYSFIGSMFGPILGIMLADYLIKRRGVFNLKEMYQPTIDASYTGVNLKPTLVLIFSFGIAMAGSIFQEVAFLKEINKFAFFSGLIISFVVYGVICLVDKEGKGQV